MWQEVDLASPWRPSDSSLLFQNEAEAVASQESLTLRQKVACEISSFECENILYIYIYINDGQNNIVKTYSYVYINYFPK